MAKAGLHVLLSPLIILQVALLQSYHGQQRKVHIIYLGELPQGDFSGASKHHSMLEGVLGSTSSAKESLIYSYGKSFNGFAAKLTGDEVAKFSEMEGVISVIPNHKLELHTTRSWDFMGVTKSKRGSPQDGDVIIGLIDTGIWPESESFSYEGLSPPLSKWNGEYQGANFTCNNKIIGARYYNSDNSFDSTEFKSPRDSLGHGALTFSTAAGREVVGASYYGLAEGTATGGVPGARIAMYKVCWLSSGCSSADILAAFDDAIADGVDIISVSIGSPFARQYFKDPVAIGSFHAMRKGILTSASAGNSGPFPLTVSNYAPWIQIVAASTIDRKFVAQVVLGNGQVYTGHSINSFDLNGKSFPLIWGGGAVNYSAGADTEISSFCFPGALNSHKVQGKIVLCDSPNDGTGVLIANGVGSIIVDSFINDFAFSYSLPATVISREDGLKILNYIKSTENPIATILVGETWKDIMAPFVSFSSRGPNPITPDILKPDLTAPGVDILAAWSPVAPPSIDPDDTRSVKFNIISGTSMSCPNASGAAAYVMAVHPNRSPAAIKSALMTTAYVVDPNKHEDLEFAYGLGHINPLKAIDPGLIYDTSEADYIDFLCKQGYNTSFVRLITGDNSSSCLTTVLGRGWSLNYPSFSLDVEDGLPINAVFTRTVTNVDPPNSTYTFSWYMPSSLTVKMEPSVLSFSAAGEKKSFSVMVNDPNIEQRPIQSGAIVWTYGVHAVRSPFVVYTVLPGSSFSFSTFQKKPNFKGSSMHHNNGILGRHK